MMVHPNQQVRFVPQQDLYAMEVDKTNRNYYDCGGFGHLVRNCRNRNMKGKIGKSRRLEYRQRRITKGVNRQSQNNNLNGEQDLILLD